MHARLLSLALAAVVLPAGASAQPTPSEDNPASAARSRLGGTVFLDWRPGSRPGLGRFYLSLDHALDATWSAHLTTDLQYTASGGVTDPFVKRAYLEGDFSPAVRLRIGAAGMAWVPRVEEFYGYRFIEGTLIDRLKFGTSTDWGLHLAGRRGRLDYQVSAVNGAGYRNPSPTGHVDIETRLGLQPVPGLMLAVGTYAGRPGETGPGAPVLREARRHNALVAWKHAGLRIGAEWFEARNWKQLTTPSGGRASGWSAWASQDLGRISLFVREDRSRPARRLAPAMDGRYRHAGLALQVSKDLRLALAWKQQRTGGTAPMWSDEYGAFAELKF